MSWGAVIVGGAALIGGLASASSSSSAASKASKSSAAASAYATDVQNQQYQQTRSDYAPYRDAGYNALAQMQSPEYYKDFEYSDMTADPGYSFRLSEGQKQIEQSAAAKGGLQSGSALKAAATYGQEMGSQEYGNAYNRYMQSRTQNYNQLASLAGLGQTANSATSTAGSNYANSVSNIATTNAANQGNSYLTAANSWNSAYQGIGNALGSYYANQ